MIFCTLETELDSEFLESLIEYGYPIERVERNGTYIYRTPAMVNQNHCVSDTTQKYANGLLTLEIPSSQKKRGKYKSKDIIVDFDAHTLEKDGGIKKLRKAEYILLETLFSKPHNSFCRSALCRQLEQNFNHNIQDNTLTVHISSLRKLVGEGYIITHKTMGYYWNYDVEKID